MTLLIDTISRKAILNNFEILLKPTLFILLAGLANKLVKTQYFVIYLLALLAVQPYFRLLGLVDLTFGLSIDRLGLISNEIVIIFST